MSLVWQSPGNSENREKASIHRQKEKTFCFGSRKMEGDCHASVSYVKVWLPLAVISILIRCAEHHWLAMTVFFGQVY